MSFLALAYAECKVAHPQIAVDEQLHARRDRPAAKIRAVSTPRFVSRTGCRVRWPTPVTRGFPAIQYVYDLVEADGFVFPSKRRAYRCDPVGRVLPDELMVSIDLSDIRVT
jgi:hypothetical protein